LSRKNKRQCELIVIDLKGDRMQRGDKNSPIIYCNSTKIYQTVAKHAPKTGTNYPFESRLRSTPRNPPDRNPKVVSVTTTLFLVNKNIL
jgi:hypothetical protein